MAQSCLLIEDDVYTARDVMETLEENFPNLNLLPVAHTLAEAAKSLDNNAPDLVISDINLQDEVVFSLFQQYETIPFKIIFITSYSQYAVEAFRFSALDFLEKPFEDEALVAAVNRAITTINLEHYNLQLQTFFHNFNPEQKRKKLVLKNLEAIHIVEVGEILYIKSDNNYSEFYINDGRRIVVSKPLKLYDDQLGGQSFFRSHQSYLVNLHYAKTFHKQDSTLELTSGEQIAVSGTKVNALLHKIDSLS
ncbi:LytR/AlgR family response regulator transcription factor [Constantimarinum furrinae]|uniref:DNA-binding response regulator n=1 Tax=Constantimarinum furrinae TaxID=2562285 RepID=A0A7G8PTG1_9FLAO|nr:LytTR family DNA-binding domain-containing protein [Constantimarinum furrinae]QNJ97627.1 DNA-binding response regulator [Constantimarinum furrinae]